MKYYLALEKERNPATRGDMDKPGRHHAKGNV